MKSLVTCDQVGGSLELWLKTASPEQLQDFYTQLLKHIKNCNGTSLVPSDKLATCKDLENVKNSIDDVIEGSLNQGDTLPADAEDCDRPLSVCGLNNMLNADDDNAAKQAVVHAVTDTLRDDAGKRSEFAGAIVSRQAGNLIQQRDDGLYYGIEAKKEIRNLFVSNFGNDETGDGSEAKPFATIMKAMSVIDDIPAWYTINLHAGHEFDLTGYNARSVINLQIRPYAMGADYPLSTPSNTYYRGHCAKDFPRPKLNVRTVPNHPLHVIRRGTILVGGQLKVLGVAVQVWESTVGGDIPTYDGHLNGVFAATRIQFEGCTFEVMSPVLYTPGGKAYRSDVLLRAQTILWVNSKVLSPLDKFYTSGQATQWSRLVASSFTGSFAIGNWVSDTLQGYGAAPDHPTLISGRYNIGENLPIKYFNAIEYDTATKSIFGMTLNWNPFKYGGN